jgi:hypothetical protein
LGLSRQIPELFFTFVPPRGQAETVQGEVLRLSREIFREIFVSQKSNWDKGDDLRFETLIFYLRQGKALAETEINKLVKLHKSTRDGQIDNNYYLLIESAVQWNKANPRELYLADLPSLKEGD